jgi:hypothetical protein
VPLFNWGAYGTANVMADKFWIYWTVTVPSILPVMGIVGAYGWIQSLKNRLAADEVRIKVGPRDVWTGLHLDKRRVVFRCSQSWRAD